MTAIDAQAGDLVAREDQRFLTERRRSLSSRARFAAILATVLFAHFALIAYIVHRGDDAPTQTAAAEETPVEVVVEPPEPPKPPPPPPPKQKAPEPPKPKEQIEKPAFSAPRAPNETKIETTRADAKTEAPKAATPPQDGQPKPPEQASKAKEDSTPAEKDDAAAKPEEDKPDAEALDKAKPKVAPKPATKQAKATPRTKATRETLASLSGLSSLPNFSFAKPTPKAPVYGGTEDVRYLAIVQGLIMQKVRQLPRLNRYQEGGQVAVYFHLDESGHVIQQDILRKSGNPEIDRLAMEAVRLAGPFPPPPAVVGRGLIWGSSIDGQLPVRLYR